MPNHVTHGRRLAFAISLALTAGGAHATDKPQAITLPGAANAPVDPVAGKGRLSTADSKLATPLRDLVEQTRQPVSRTRSKRSVDTNTIGIPSTPVQSIDSSKAGTDDGSILVEVFYARNATAVADDAATDRFASSVKASVEAAGGSIEGSLGSAGVVARVPAANLETVTANTDVGSVQVAREIQPREGNEQSQGVSAGHADWWHAAGDDGTGITVALIDSFDNSKGQIASLQQSADWPDAKHLQKLDYKTYRVADACAVHAFGCDPAPKHGNATGEILHDVAPGAAIIAYDTRTVADWRRAILHAANLDDKGVPLGAARVQVISASLGAPLDGIGDGTALRGSIAEAAGWARANGVLVVNAAGNEAEQHWSGPTRLTAASPTTPNAPRSLLWDGAQVEINAFGDPASGNYYCSQSASVQLTWNDWTNVATDYDLVLYYLDTSVPGNRWRIAAQSIETQNGRAGQRPIESVNYRAPANLQTRGCRSGVVFGIGVISNTPGADKYLTVFSSTPLLQRTASNSLGFPADSANVVSVAAIDQGTSALESYSSRGPVLATGGGDPAQRRGPDNDPKPDVASFANVDTVSYGKGAFNGTSSATPHVAGVAALLMQRYGVPAANATAQDKRDHVDHYKRILQEIGDTGANDLGDAGFDYLYGHGRVRFQKETSLAFASQPRNTNTGYPFSPPVQVKVLDEAGLPVHYGIFRKVDFALGSDPSQGRARLSTRQADIVDGVASYGATLDTAGNGYRLKASSGTLPAVQSNAFDIVPATERSSAP